MTRLSTLLDEIDSGAVLLPGVPARLCLEPRPGPRSDAVALPRRIRSAACWCGKRPRRTSRSAAPPRVAVPGSCCSTGSSASRPCTASSAARLPRSSKATRAAFTGLHFNVETESFEFYAPTKMAGDPDLGERHRALQQGTDEVPARISRCRRRHTRPLHRQVESDHPDRQPGFQLREDHRRR